MAGEAMSRGAPAHLIERMRAERMPAAAGSAPGMKSGG